LGSAGYNPGLSRIFPNGSHVQELAIDLGEFHESGTTPWMNNGASLDLQKQIAGYFFENNLTCLHNLELWNSCPIGEEIVRCVERHNSGLEELTSSDMNTEALGEIDRAGPIKGRLRPHKLDSKCSFA
jgi:hypothetical protein